MSNQIKAVIDADFFIKATEYERGTGLFIQMMQDLNIHPVMHQFVAHVELNGNLYLPALISCHKLTVMRYEDYLLNDIDREDYEDYFREAYDKINRFSFPEEADIYNYTQQHESLGEIRSLYMAVKNRYPYFMSDDGDSKILAKTFFSNKYAIDVKSLYDALVQCKEQGTCLTWRAINPTVKNAMHLRQDKIFRLRSLYQPGADANT